MGLSHSPKIVTNGLVLCLDAVNPKSKSYNVIANPENLGAYLFLRAGASISANSTAAPDGTQTADLLSTSGTDFGYYFPAFPVGNATHSFFLKPAGATNSFTFNHVGTGRGGTFTFSTKTFSSLSGYTGSYEVLSNGWYLVNFHTTAETNNYYIEMSFDNISGAYVWGLQLTPFSYYLPYVPVSANRPQFLDNTLWQDLTGRGSNGTLINGPIFSGANGGSLVFDGLNDCIDLVSQNDAQSPLTGYGGFTGADTSTFSLEIWIKTNQIIGPSPQQSPALIGRNDNDIWANLTLYNGYVYYVHYTTTWESNLKSTTMVSDDKWHQVVYVNFNNETGSIYVDGKSEVTGSSSLSGTNYFSPDFVGQGFGGSYFLGSVGLVRFYDKSLSAEEIQQNFNALRGRFGI